MRHQIQLKCLLVRLLFPCIIIDRLVVFAMADQNPDSNLERVCIIGSGNWGSAISRIIGINCQRLPFCDRRVKMWVYDEIVEFEGSKQLLSHIINTKHENIKYLPGIKLPENVVAVPNLEEACQDASLIIFVLPQQFLSNILPILQKSVQPRARGVSLIKGIDFDLETKEPKLISQIIAKAMGPNFRCGVLMGANVADEIARDQMCESTLACDFGTLQNQRTLDILSLEPSFIVKHITDISGAEVYGALKNVIALGAGFLDGLDLGGNTKAALIRVGLLEIQNFGRLCFPGSQDNTAMESCGLADLITTCYGGRNRKCAEEFARRQLSSLCVTKDNLEVQWNEIEAKLLEGQKLQGISTAQQVYQFLESRNWINSFPLMGKIYSIALEGKPIHSITEGIRIIQSRM
jgi:glycerol-3-phosphate dehydrogenase (NAD+)